MRTATRLVILASLASLALGTIHVTNLDAGDEEQRLILRSVECCDYGKIMPSVVANDPKNCASYILNVLNSHKGDGDQECEVECYLDENGLLNKDKSINEIALRKLFLQQAHHDAKDVMEDALDECFENHDDDKDDTCNSGADDLVRCIMSEVVAKCPKTLWIVKHPECQDTKEEQKGPVVP